MYRTFQEGVSLSWSDLTTDELTQVSRKKSDSIFNCATSLMWPSGLIPVIFPKEASDLPNCRGGFLWNVPWRRSLDKCQGTSQVKKMSSRRQVSTASETQDRHVSWPCLSVRSPNRRGLPVALGGVCCWNRQLEIYSTSNPTPINLSAEYRLIS